MNWIKKLIPAKIEIRSLYWVNIQKEMESDLESIFNKIDEDNYKDAKSLIEGFRHKWDGKKYPEWVWDTYAEWSKAQSMVDFLNP
jgi:hypothetical protein